MRQYPFQRSLNPGVTQEAIFFGRGTNAWNAQNTRILEHKEPFRRGKPARLNLFVKLPGITSALPFYRKQENIATLIEEKPPQPLPSGLLPGFIRNNLPGGTG
ncbi:hypothetical protein LL912_06145 [Niabella sp. CC-SYL272]|uniref:hypothetical protein n=1 Tax=Niabella agricola TaxID=2891571 RepID=UPI001F2444D8|nr:hypothetical protein [Niabella agricola]MCF3108353.1 hypothetical protein [Niabella agricola]